MKLWGRELNSEKHCGVVITKQRKHPGVTVAA